jgi:hypothetical protein
MESDRSARISGPAPSISSYIAAAGTRLSAGAWSADAWNGTEVWNDAGGLSLGAHAMGALISAFRLFGLVVAFLLARQNLLGDQA